MGQNLWVHIWGFTIHKSQLFLMFTNVQGFWPITGWECNEILWNIMKYRMPVVPARGAAEVALGLYYKICVIYRICMRHALCASWARACVFCARVVRFSIDETWRSTLHTSRCTLHIPHFTLHTCTSHSTLHVISSYLSSSHLISALLMSSRLFSYVI